MELTIEQALQQGVAAHKEGKLEEAERLYRAILQSQPAHSDANHNLGVLAVSVNKADAALPLFKTALEANPKIEQFWLSYINALIKEKQFEIAKAVFEQGKKKGLSGDKFDAVEKQLTPTAQVNEPKSALQKKILSLSEKRKKLAEQKKQKKAKKQNLKGISPSQEQLDSLLEHYQNGRLDDAEKLSVSITNEFPKHQFGWKILGVVLKQTGRIIESLTAMQKSVQLAPQDAEAHNNLGITLQELGRLNEAEASYVQAIALKPDIAEPHYNLGNTLKELDRLDEAEASLRQAIALKPDYAKARMSLNSVASSAVPAWHLSMMNDEVRNKAYSDALKLAVGDGDVVLDIGTGSGLLSLMAAARGAEKVITCETSRTIAEAAKEIIDINGYREKISVLNKKSTDLIVGVDLPQRADLIISEVFSSEFVGEGVRTTILDAKKRLLKKGGRMIPQSGKIRIALIDNSPEIFNNTSVASVHGFDLSKFNSISQNKFNLKPRDYPLFLSNPEDAFNINLYDESEIIGEEKIIKLRVNQNGLCVGLIQWIWIHLYKEIEYENKPGENDSHWATPIYLFDEPVVAKIGDVLEIKAVLGEDYVWFCQLA
jgi:tetratricopeptide (TPR) repeat protein